MSTPLPPTELSEVERTARTLRAHLPPHPAVLAHLRALDRLLRSARGSDPDPPTDPGA